MKISIENFKVIRKLNDFEIKPLTILSGVNSSGKSSFIQLLIILKQTIESDSQSRPLELTGNLYRAKSFRDLIRNLDLDARLSITLHFNKAEFGSIRTLFSTLPDFDFFYQFSYKEKDGQPKLSDVEIKYVLPEGDKKEHFLRLYTKGSDEFLESNTGIFGSEARTIGETRVRNIQFTSIFPTRFDKDVSLPESEAESSAQALSAPELERIVPEVDAIKELITGVFTSMRYIGPLRQQPQDDYDMVWGIDNVGARGEYVAQILSQRAGTTISYYQIEATDGNLKFKEASGLLLEAVRYWMCDVFKLAQDIFPLEGSDSFRIMVRSFAGVETSVKHVGFGISQILPIIVQGLLLEQEGMFLLEQPEIHLHPKVQAQLFDFLYSLVISGKTVVVETHSDHFITRMRRRIVEGSETFNPENVNLTFIEQSDGEVLFRSLRVDDFGTLDYYPPDFIEKADDDLRAIVKAQMLKRINNKANGF